MQLNKHTQNYLLTAAAVLCLILTFVGNPNTKEMRSLEIFWNLGHIVAYSLWSYLLLNHFRPLARLTYGYQWVWIMGMALVFGLIIEVIQATLLGRTAAVDDMIKNLIGCGLSLVFFTTQRLQIQKKKLQLLQILVLVVVIVELLPLILALTDEGIARKQFPRLGTFETPFEINRWMGNNSEISIDGQIKSDGTASLRIDLETDGFSGADLKYFPRDWRHFSSLSFKVFNPQSYPSQMVCRINDVDHHLSDFHFHDRFNQRIHITPGWNHINIPLRQIENAPLNRKMNLSKIEGFAIFFYNLDQRQSIYLDDLKLHR